MGLWWKMCNEFHGPLSVFFSFSLSLHDRDDNFRTAIVERRLRSLPYDCGECDIESEHDGNGVLINK